MKLYKCSVFYLFCFYSIFLNHFMVSSEFFNSLYQEISKILVTVFCIILFDINPNSIFVGLINLVCVLFSKFCL